MPEEFDPSSEHDSELGSNAAAMRELADEAHKSGEAQTGPKPGSAEAFIVDLSAGVENAELKASVQKLSTYYKDKDRLWDGEDDPEPKKYGAESEENLRSSVAQVVRIADAYLTSPGDAGRSDTLADVPVDTEFGQHTADVIFNALGVIEQAGEPVADPNRPGRFIDTTYRSSLGGMEVHTWEHHPRAIDIVPENAETADDRVEGTKMKIYLAESTIV